jgi:toxin ParE1/3/4
MSKLAFSETASRELDEILEFVTQDNPSAAVALVQRIRHSCENLARFPHLGFLREWLGVGIREFSVGNYVIYYRMFGEFVRIESVRHGARDTSDLFFEP